MRIFNGRRAVALVWYYSAGIQSNVIDPSDFYFISLVLFSWWQQKGERDTKKEKRPTDSLIHGFSKNTIITLTRIYGRDNYKRNTKLLL